MTSTVTRMTATRPDGHTQDPGGTIQPWMKHLLLILGCALALRLVFAWLIRGTYDYDEFVVLLLSRDFAHGAVPYHTFMFFHPPGILVLFRVLQPLTSGWWPSARIVTLCIDTATAGLVWQIGRALYDGRAALAAGLVYAASPLALISAVRVGQDPVITFLCLAGVALLVSSESRWAAGLAGICLGIALWIKYPAAMFIPLYFLISPRRTVAWLPACAATLILLFVPFQSAWKQIYDQTVVFQTTRWLMPQDQRVFTVLIFWVGVNLLGIVGAAKYRAPLWLLGGFLIAGAFGLGSQVFYHYFVPAVALAALLAAPWLASLRNLSGRLAGTLAAVIVLATATVINVGGNAPLYITSAKFSDVMPAVELIEARTPRGGAVLSDRFEYAFLARRTAAGHYFWNIGVLKDAGFLEKQVPSTAAVVLSHGASSGFPRGFVAYLNARWPAHALKVTTVWILKQRRT